MPEVIVTLAITIVPILVAYRLGYKKGYRRAVKAMQFWGDPSNARAYRER